MRRPSRPRRHDLLALDCTQEVADAAVAAGADMLVVHHPLLLRGVSSVAANTPKGKIIHTLIRNGVALFAAHTNADSARPGVNDQLAHLVGIIPGRPIKPIRWGLDKWGGAGARRPGPSIEVGHVRRRGGEHWRILRMRIRLGGGRAVSAVDKRPARNRQPGRINQGHRAADRIRRPQQAS